jgi:hypothetical protein
MRKRSSLPTAPLYLGMSHEEDNALAYRCPTSRTHQGAGPPLSCSFWTVFVCPALAKIVNGQPFGSKRLSDRHHRAISVDIERVVTLVSEMAPAEGSKSHGKNYARFHRTIRRTPALAALPRVICGAGRDFTRVAIFSLW